MTDQVDSVKLVVDDDGCAVSRMEYYPYGEVWIHEGNTDLAPKYNSQELDRETGYYFYNARHYDPGIIQFVTADIIIDGEFDTQGWNRFSYVKGNPIRYRDPTGHWTLQIGVSGDAAIGCGATGSVGLVIGYSEKKGFQMGTYLTGGAVGKGDVGISGTVEVAESSNTDINDLNGKSLDTGASIDAGAMTPLSPTGRVDVSIPINSKSKNSYSLNVGLSTSVSPVDSHAYVSQTKVSDWMITDKFNNAKKSVKKTMKDMKKTIEKEYQNTKEDLKNKISNLKASAGNEVKSVEGKEKSVWK